MTPRPWQEDDFLARGVIQGYNTERIYTAFQHGSAAVSVLDKNAILPFSGRLTPGFLIGNTDHHSEPFFIGGF